MKAYFISGLAADSRVFQYIHLPEPYEIVYLDWIPANENESLQAYALRLAERINHNEEFILVGLSMGGMVASEIAKRYKPVVTIIISSVSSHTQFPHRFRLAYRLKLHKLLPPSVLKSSSLIKRLFAAERPADKTILKQVIKDSDPKFIRWAVGAILEWRNEDIPEPLWHIHGSRDEVLPIKHTHPTHIITKGTHLMIMSHARELNALLEKELASFNNRI